MADEDKQFEATHQKLEKARKEGQVVKSKDFSTAVALIVMFMGIYVLSPFIWDQIAKLFVVVYERPIMYSHVTFELAFFFFPLLR